MGVKDVSKRIKRLNSSGFVTNDRDLFFIIDAQQRPIDIIKVPSLSYWFLWKLHFAQKHLRNINAEPFLDSIRIQFDQMELGI